MTALHHDTLLRSIAAVSLTAMCAACAGSSTPPSAGSTSAASIVSAPAPAPPHPAGRPALKIADPYFPKIDPAAFSTTIDNAFMPLTPGTRTTYEADTAEGHQQTLTEVTRDTKTIMGVTTVVVHDTVTSNGAPLEDTLDWFAQDRDGNVWYFGEASKAFDAGGAVSTEGSFEAGVDGAQPGIVMPGRPQIGDQYRQEYAKGVAEDTGEVLSLTGSENTPLTGPAKDLLVIKDMDPLDPANADEDKYYAHGVGLILTIQTTGPAEREQATVVRRF